MYPSGVWRGFWEQPAYGRQPMEDFHLRFRDGRVDGHGRDVVGKFVFRGEYDGQTGRVRMVKQYLGKHQVVYDGEPDGEGSIIGTWSIPPGFDTDAPGPGATGQLKEALDALGIVWRGPFLLRPTHGPAGGDEPIAEITG